MIRKNRTKPCSTTLSDMPMEFMEHPRLGYSPETLYLSLSCMQSQFFSRRNSTVGEGVDMRYHEGFPLPQCQHSLLLLVLPPAGRLLPAPFSLRLSSPWLSSGAQPDFVRIKRLWGPDFSVPCSFVSVLMNPRSFSSSGARCSCSGGTLTASFRLLGNSMRLG